MPSNAPLLDEVRIAPEGSEKVALVSRVEIGAALKGDGEKKEGRESGATLQGG